MATQRAAGGEDPGETLAVVEGTVRRIGRGGVPGSDFAVVLLDPLRGGPAFTAVGPLAGMRAGEDVLLIGRWEAHPRHGLQLRALVRHVPRPTTPEAVGRFLLARRIPGLGRRQVTALLDALGTDLVSCLSADPERLLSVPGLGRRKAGAIATAWREQVVFGRVLGTVSGLGLSPLLASRVYEVCGEEAAAVLAHRPYDLVSLLPGVPFASLDALARGMGRAAGDPARLRAALLRALRDAGADRATALAPPSLMARARGLLGGEPLPLGPALEDLLRDGRVALAPGGAGAVSLPRVLALEARVAGALAALLGRGARGVPAPRPGHPGPDLAAGQREAAALAATAPLCLLSGGPGTGKTFMARVIAAQARARGERVLLAAPTGRAARRLSLLADCPAATLHRLLGLVATPGEEPEEGPRPARAGRGRGLEADLVLVDEASMLDLPLLDLLLSALPPRCRLVLMGDADQLPPVGAGAPFAELLASGLVPGRRLDTPFRVAAGSGLAAAAAAVNAGRVPPARGLEGFFFLRREDPAAAAAEVVRLATEGLPARFGLDPRADIQVLCPVHAGPCGTVGLNLALQARLAPPGGPWPECRDGARVFRAGDRVVQTRNNYARGAMNGEVGVVCGVEPGGAGLLVFPLEGPRDLPPLRYARAELGELEHAYALSVHRSQGSEYRAVVVPLAGAAGRMPGRALLYTAVTRASEIVVLVGSRGAFEAAVAAAPPPPEGPPPLVAALALALGVRAPPVQASP